MALILHDITTKFLKCTSYTGVNIWKGFQTMSTNNKHPRLESKIGTHSGVFHCDEVLACFMLKQLPEFEDAEIIRTRDLTVLDTCDIVVDVGGIYNPKKNRYDHHQRDFNETLSTVVPDLAKNKHIKLSSAGLVYAHFGLEVITQVLQKKKITGLDTNCLQHIYLAVYDNFIEELDAIDNGIPMYADGHPRYRIGTHLSARVHRINPDWNDSQRESNDSLFRKAMDLTGGEFMDQVLMTATVWWPGREVVKAAILNRNNVSDTGEIIELHERCPWKEHLLSLEEELGIPNQIKFVIFNDKTDSWRVQGIPVQPESFICRVFLHDDWRGIRDEDLSNVAGIKNCIFCHSTGFIGGNKTREGAIQMAIDSLKAVN